MERHEPFSRQEQSIRELMRLDGVGPETAEALVRAGIDSLDEFQRSDDERLLALPGIGRKRLGQFRAQLDAGTE